MTKCKGPRNDLMTSRLTTSRLSRLVIDLENRNYSAKMSF